MLKTLHLEITPNFETQRIRNCTYMVELRMPTECPKLVNIDFHNLKLRALHLRVNPNLETQRVKNYTNMGELYMPAQCSKLIDLDLNNLKLTTLHLGITPNLKTVSLKDCRDLVELQILAECPKLVNFDLINCILVAELPESIFRVIALKAQRSHCIKKKFYSLQEDSPCLQVGVPVVLVVIASGRIDVTFAKKNRKVHSFSWV
ncbi:Toll/interleukin-1 receptor domain-containing protein [Tanacetum coccineum]